MRNDVGVNEEKLPIENGPRHASLPKIMKSKILTSENVMPTRTTCLAPFQLATLHRQPCQLHDNFRIMLTRSLQHLNVSAATGLNHVHEQQPEDSLKIPALVQMKSESFTHSHPSMQSKTTHNVTAGLV